jgi:hypothetical protein
VLITPECVSRTAFDDSVEDVGIALLAAYTAYTIKMYGANKVAADAAKTSSETAHDALVRSARPWLGVAVAPRLLHPPAVKGDSINLVTEFTVKNFGPSPALNVNLDLKPFATPPAAKTPKEMTAAWDSAADRACQGADVMVPSNPDAVGRGQYGDVVFPRRTKGVH